MERSPAMGARRELPREFRGKLLVETLVTVPLVLPPSVLGFYLLTAFGGRSWLGGMFERLVGHTLTFSFEGLLLASLIVNVPFVVQPIQRGFEAIPENIIAAAATITKAFRMCEPSCRRSGIAKP